MKRKLKRFLAVLLSLIVIISATPCTAYAEDESVTDAGFAFIYYDSTQHWFSGTMPFSYTDNDGSQSLVEYLLVEFVPTLAVHKGDEVSVSINSYANGRYSGWDNMDIVYPVSSSSWVSASDSDITYSRSTGVYDISFTPNDDIYKGGKWYLKLQNPYFTSSSTWSSKNSYFKLSSIDVSVDDEATQRSFFQKIGDWFNNLFQWLKDIRDNAVNGFSNIGTWFTNLGNNIKTWFTDLSNNISAFFSDLVSNIKTQFTNITNSLKEWFSNVGQWFSEIGDRISGFFSDLWTNITNTVNEKVQAISDWWQSVKDWFHSLFVPEDGYFDEYKARMYDFMSEHFGLLFEAMELTLEVFQLFQEIFTSNQGAYDCILMVPSIDMGNGFVIPEINTNLTAMINEYSFTKSVYSLYRIGITALLIWAFIGNGQRKLNRLLTDRDEL